jgi:Putative restriction endonuclease
VAEILRMQDAGIITEDENFELIEGEIVPMQAKARVHELLKSALTMAVVRALPERLWVGVETTIYLSPNTLVEPDLRRLSEGPQARGGQGLGHPTCDRSRADEPRLRWRPQGEALSAPQSE